MPMGDVKVHLDDIGQRVCAFLTPKNWTANFSALFLRSIDPWRFIFGVEVRGRFLSNPTHGSEQSLLVYAL